MPCGLVNDSANRDRLCPVKPLLGDVDAGHDLDARGQRRHHAARHRVQLVQHAVDPVAHPHVVLGGLQVQVGGPVLDGLLDQVVHVPHDRGVVRAGRLCGHAGRVIQRGVDHVAEVAVLALQALDDPPDLAAGDHHRPDRHAGRRAHVVQRDHVARVGDADDQLAVVHRQAEHPVPQHDRQRDALERGRVGRVADQVQRVDPERGRRGGGQLLLGDDLVVDQDRPHGPAAALRLLGRAVHRGRVDADLFQGVEQRAEGLVHDILTKRYVPGTSVPSDTSAMN
jgi:hypothetical protein